jgi:uncharacterized protein YqgC (DUF456 family)
MDPATASLLFLLAYLLIILGLIGSILPLLPGPIFIWLGAVLWAWADGFQRVGWPTLLVLGILTVLAWGSDLAMTTLVSRRAGASWKAIFAAIVGGILGGLFLSEIPIVGTIFGTVMGAVAGVLALEYYQKRDWRLAAKAAGGYALGFVLSAAVELTLALLMIALFVWRVFV